MFTYLFGVLPIMLIFSAVITVLGAALVTLIGAFRRGKAPASEPVVSAVAELLVVGEAPEEAEIHVEPQLSEPTGPQYMPVMGLVEESSRQEAWLTEEPLADESEEVDETVEESAAEAEEAAAEDMEDAQAVQLEVAQLEKKLVALPASFFVAKDVTLALRQRVSYKGKWLKYADLPYVVVGPRRIHIVFDPSRVSSKRGIEEEIDRALYLTARFIKLKLSAEFRICCWRIGQGKASTKDPWRFSTTEKIADDIRRFEKSPLGRTKEPTSERFSEIVALLRASQPQDMRPLQLVV